MPVSLELHVPFFSPLEMAAIFGATFLLSAIITRIAISVAHRLELMAHPVERSSHSTPTPQVGGVGICLSFLAVYTYVHPDPASLSFLMPLAIVLWGLGLGIVDDILALAPIPKLGGQIALGFFAFFWAVDRGAAPGLTANITISIFAAIIIFLWVIFFLNAYNFMDGVNGQSGVYALNALVWFALFAWAPGDGAPVIQPFDNLPLALIAGAVLGFFIWNFPRDFTFMGDSGSLPLGALLATLALLAASVHFERMGVIASCVGAGLPLSLYVYDVLYTVVRRARRRENILQAHRSHLYQRLLIATGWSHRRLLAFHFPFYLAAGGASFLYRLARGPAARFYVVALVMGLLITYTWLVLRAEKRHSEKS